MDTGNHPDPFTDAMGHVMQQAMQVGYAAVTAAQVYTHLKRTQASAGAERDDRARRALNTQIRADRDASRASWAPALDPHWLRQADLVETAQAWGAATPCADRAMPWYEPAAATAMRKTEERLRHLHPYAMARYDALRADGMEPAEAMRETAPLFARPARAHDTPYAPRPVLTAGNGAGDAMATGPGAAGSAHADLGNVRTGNVAAAQNPAATASTTPVPGSPAARPWEHDFPLPIRDVVAAAASGPAPADTRQATPSRAPSAQHARPSRPRS
jgi:hypothetical protein